MKGKLDISEAFMKILTAGLITMIVASIFFTIYHYNLTLLENKLEREALVVDNVILSSCIAETSGGYPVKGLLSEDKINIEELLNPLKNKNIYCINYDKKIFVRIHDDIDGSLLHEIGDSTILSEPNINTTFQAALNITSEIIPVTLEIFIGGTGTSNPVPSLCKGNYQCDLFGPNLCCCGA